jgi:1,2-diacylglycerol 3-beta-galactosyltransferase
MTDLADVPPNFWQERQDQFMICGNEMAVRQAFLKGYPADHVFQTSGMIIRPDFYRATLTDRGSGREALGLDPDLPTALIMFGGYGSKTSVAIVDQLRRSGLDVQSIVMCGHNEKLRRELQGRALCHATGFTGAVPHYMHLADFFIGKPGPGSVSEAIQMGLPVIVERNRRTMVQELHNATWIEQQNLGIAISSFRKLPEAVKALVREGRLEQFRGNARRVNNRAVYEIPEIFNAIMRGADKTGRQDLPGAHIIHPALRSPGTRHPGVSRG